MAFIIKMHLYKPLGTKIHIDKLQNMKLNMNECLSSANHEIQTKEA